MRILLLACALPVIGCAVPSPTGSLGPELAGLTRMVKDLETELDAREQSAVSTAARPAPILEASSRVHDLPTRFAIAPGASVSIEEAERHELTLVASDRAYANNTLAFSCTGVIPGNAPLW